MDKKTEEKKKGKEVKLEDLSQKKFALGSDYTAIERLGKGTYGTVYKAQQKSTGKYVAIKKIKNELENEGIPSTALREIAIMKKMQHPNVVQVLDCKFADRNIELCLEFCEYDLHKLMHEKKNDPVFYTPSFIKNMMYQLLQAVDFLHSHKVLHRDLKPQNILVKKENLILKLTDFGLARVYSIPIRPYTKEVLTLWYRAPEMILGVGTYAIGLDMWSIGCIFGEFFFLKPMFQGDCEIDQLFKIFKVFGTFNELTLPGYKSFPYFNKDFPFWEGEGLEKYLRSNAVVVPDDLAVNLITRMLEIDPVKRITCKEALEHEYFKDVACSCKYDEKENKESKV